jgi:tryptophan-rich sensory protein
MTVKAWFRLEMENSWPIGMMISGILSMLAAIIVRFSVGAPYTALLELNACDILSPVWLFMTFWCLSFFVTGAAAGFILGYRICLYDAEKYKGCLLFIVLLLLELCWYPVLFGARLVLISALLSVLILALSIWVTGYFHRVSKLGGILCLLHDVWLIYVLILNFAILFHI